MKRFLLVTLCHACADAPVSGMSGDDPDAPSTASPDAPPALARGLDECVSAGAVAPLESFDNNHGAIVTMALSSLRQAAFGAEDGSIKLWTMGAAEATELGGTSQYDVAWAAGAPVSRVLAWSPDGSKLVSGDDSGVVTLWDRSGEVLASVALGEIGPSALAVAADGRVAIAEANYGGPIRLWDPETGVLGEPRSTALWGVASLAFLPDGDLLAGGDIYSWATVERHDLGGTGTVEATWSAGVAGSVDVLAFDGTRLLGAGLGGIVIALDPATLVLQGQAALGEGYQAVGLALLSAHVVTVAEGGDARVLAADGLAERLRLSLNGATSLALDIDDERLVVPGLDGQVRLWGCSP
jgi:WD40 repeat protein